MAGIGHVQISLFQEGIDVSNALSTRWQFCGDCKGVGNGVYQDAAEKQADIHLLPSFFVMVPKRTASSPERWAGVLPESYKEFWPVSFSLSMRN
jgi:hypothetical protein